MPVTVHLLGPPRIEREGKPLRGPRGHKAWAVFAHALLCQTRPSRQRLAELFFSEADDPLGSLRWNLAELRRVLRQPHSLRGDPVELGLGPEIDVDLRRLSSVGLPGEPAAEQLGGEFLEGVRFTTNPALEAWLAVERARVAASVEALLHERAQAALGSGQPLVAPRACQRLIDQNPFEETYHELLARSLMAAGDRRLALAHVEACEDMFRRELGAAPTGRLRSLLRPGPETRGAAVVGGAGAARALLETGRASIAAGAVESGLECLKRACAEADACGDGYLQVRAHLALGSALVRALSAQAEGAAALHRAAETAPIASGRGTSRRRPTGSLRSSTSRRVGASAPRHGSTRRRRRLRARTRSSPRSRV